MLRIAKFLTALAGALTQLLSMGILSGSAQNYATLAISVLTAVAVFMVPNAE